MERAGRRRALVPIGAALAFLLVTDPAPMWHGSEIEPATVLAASVLVGVVSAGLALLLMGGLSAIVLSVRKARQRSHRR
jgi:hypothetical protein